MDSDLRKIVDFFEAQRAAQARHFAAVQHPKVLTFLGTTSLAGTYATLGICPVLRLWPGNGARELHARLRGPLPRAPRPGECVTVHLCNIQQYQGFQVKTRPLGADGDAAPLFDADGPLVEVKGAQTFTVHHSPYTMKFFEQIPFEEVRDTVGSVRYALVGVGEQANISPRFVFHTDARAGRLLLYHGDGLALKTYMNLKSNRQVTQLALDLDDFSGYQLRGSVEEFQPHQHPEAYQRICQGFTAGNWGKPSRTFRFIAETWQPIAPTGPAAKKER